MNIKIFTPKQPIYLIQLNCSYVGHDTPMVIILRSADSNTPYDSSGSLSSCFPTVFRKIQLPALDLQSVFTSIGRQWTSRGSHDIIIVEENTLPGASGPISSMKRFCFLRPQQEWYQLSEFRQLTSVKPHVPAALPLPPTAQPPVALQPYQACMFIMTVWSDNQGIRHGSKSKQDTHYLMILKWESRGLICGIWSSPEDNPDLYDSIGKNLSGHFPTRAPGATPDTEIQVLVATKLDKHVGVSYAISIRRRVLKMMVQGKSLAVKDPNAPSLPSPRHINDLVEITFEPHTRDSDGAWETNNAENQDLSEDVKELLSYKPHIIRHSSDDEWRNGVDLTRSTADHEFFDEFPAYEMDDSFMDIDADEASSYRSSQEQGSLIDYLALPGIGGSLADHLLIIPSTRGTVLEGATSLKVSSPAVSHWLRVLGMSDL